MKSERVVVWLGGALFVVSLAYCAYFYMVVSGRSQQAASPLAAIVVDVTLFGVFAAHHSVFAREPVKRQLARLVPAHLLRSVYVWVASVLLILVCALWHPVGGDVYHVSGWRAVAHAAVQLAGVWIIVSSVRAIDPLELAGIRPPSQHDALQNDGPYRWVRHPLYLGWMLAVFGAANMTGDRLAFAAITSAYLVAAIPWEERSLVRSFADQYERYKQQVRWRVVPYVY